MSPAPALAPSPSPGHVPGQRWDRCMALLRQCLSERHLRVAHALFISAGLHRHPFAVTRLILAACSLCPPTLTYASLLLSAHAPTSSFLHNALIRAHARGPDPGHALNLFRRLLTLGAADHHSFPFALTACASMNSLAAGAQVQAITVKNGHSCDHYVQTAMLRLYSSNAHEARKLFDEIPKRDPVHCDVLMNAYLRCGQSQEALQIFNDVLSSGFEPDEFVVTTALTACAHSGALDQGVWIHKYIEEKKPAFLSDSFIGSALVSMYAKCGSIREAVAVFDAFPERNGYLWATMIGAFAMHGHAKKALGCLSRMQEENGVRPDGVVLLGALTACAHAGLVEDGLRLLAEMKAYYLVVPEHEHYSCVVDMLCRVGRLDNAMNLIRKMPMRPLASVWGSLLTGCRVHRNVELAEIAASEMQKFSQGDGDDEGVYVQLSNIYLNANRKEEARRVRKLIGRRGIKKTPAVSAIEVDAQVSSFVAGDQSHPERLAIWRMLEIMADDLTEQSMLDLEIDDTEILYENG